MSDCVLTSGTLYADGQQLEYSHWHMAAEPDTSLVLLHEGLGCVALWRDFPAKLARATGCDVFAYSRAGYGSSSHNDQPQPLDYLTLEATQVLPDVLKNINTPKHVLIGHSDGASIAAIYAGLCADEHLCGLVTIAPHFFTEAMGLKAIAEAKTAFDSGDLKARLAKYHPNVEHTFRGWNDRWLHPDFEAWNIADVIDGIRVPVLAIQGLEDPYGSLAQIEVIKARCQSPLDTLLVENCGHAPFLEHAQSVTERIAKFVGSLDYS